MMKKTSINIYISLVLALIATFFSMLQNAYNDIDTYVRSMLLNGLYGNDNIHCTYANPIYIWMCKVLNTLFPSADSCLLLIRIGTFLFYFWMAYLILRFARSRVLFWIIFIVATFALYIPSLNYTVYSATFCIMGELSILLCMYKIRTKYVYFVGIGFLFMGMLGRLAGALLTLPFFALCMLFYFFYADGKRSVKKMVSYLIPVLFVIILMSSLQLGADYYYSDATEFNEHRTTVVDYPTKKYEDSKELQKIASKNDYELLKNRYLADTSIITTKYLKKVAIESRTIRYDKSLSGLVKSLTELFNFSIHTHGLTRILLIVAAILFGLVIISKIGIIFKLEAVLSIIGLSTICMYFIWRGRFFDRIMQPVLLADIVVLIVILVTNIEISKIKRRNYLIIGSIGIIIALYSMFSFFKADLHKPRLALTSKTDINYDNNKKKDAFYLWDTDKWCFSALNRYRNRELLPDKRFVEENCFTGGWYYHNIFWNRTFKGNIIMKLFNKNSYYVSDDTKPLQIWFSEHYGKKVKFKYIKKIDKTPVWKLYELKE